MSVRVLAARLRPGADLYHAIYDFVLYNQVDAGIVASCIGSCERVAIRKAGESTAQTHNGPFELVTLAGTVSIKGCHLHAVFSCRKGRCIAGHLRPGTTILTTAELVIFELESLMFARVFDPQTESRELEVYPKRQSK